MRECLPCLDEERQQPVRAFAGRSPSRRGPMLSSLFPVRSARTFLIARAPVRRRHRHGQPRSQLRRQRQHLVFRSAQHDAVQLHRELVDVRGAAGLPAELAFLRRAVALREREEAASERMADQLQQHEEIAGPARERCAGQQLDDQRAAPAFALARVGQTRARACCARWCGSSGSGPRRTRARPRAPLERVSMAAENVVIDDDPCRA